LLYILISFTKDKTIELPKINLEKLKKSRPGKEKRVETGSLFPIYIPFSKVSFLSVGEFR